MNQRPILGLEFLELVESISDQASAKFDIEALIDGEALPKTLRGLGDVLSILYRAASCAFGCKQGDHKLEWLAGRVCNLSFSSNRLARAGF